MNLLLLLPAALGALLALAIPLLLHLARREQQRPTVFAALRWLRERPKPRKRIRFDEWPLLLVRLLLLALLALWLARPVLLGAPDLAPWTVVAPGVAQEEVQRIAGQGEGEARWLARGFPALSQPTPTDAQPTASLLRELDAQLPREMALTVVVPERLSGLDGERPRLSRDVAWQVLPGQSPSPATRATQRVSLVVRHAAGDAEGVRYLRAAVLALAGEAAPDTIFQPAEAGVALPQDARRVAWLAPGALPAGLRQWIEAGGEALLASEVDVALPRDATTVPWRDASGRSLVEAAAFGEGRVLRFTRPLQPSTMPQLLEPDFPRRLQALFDEQPRPSRALAAAQAPVRGGEAWPQAPRDLQPWFALGIALLALLERWMATSRRREVRR